MLKLPVTQSVEDQHDLSPTDRDHVLIKDYQYLHVPIIPGLKLTGQSVLDLPVTQSVEDQHDL